MKALLQDTHYKWYILILAALTNAVVVAVPSMGLSVLLPEISKALNLSLVQAGVVWGIGAMPIIVIGLVAGTLGDRFGPNRILTISCVLVGLAGALRGLSPNYPTLAAFAFLFGCLAPLITINNAKIAGTWFSSQELGLASGVISVGMALGFLVGSMVSATLLSPWLGGWRQVFYFYGAIAIVFCIPWYFARPAPHTIRSTSEKIISKSFWQRMLDLARLKNMWLLGFAILGISGGIQGVLGYLPLYLRGLGWPETSADGAMATFHLVSMLGVLPFALWSDRLGSRKKVLLAGAMLTIIGFGLLSRSGAVSVWIAVLLAGVVRDGFMAIFLAMIIETKGVGPAHSGTAIGFTFIFLGIGNLLAPPLGNSFAETAAGTPFLFWAGLVAFGLICITLTTEPKPAWENHKVTELVGSED